MRWLQDRGEVVVKSHDEVMSVMQQLSTSESSCVELRQQVEQLTQEVEEYRKTIQQHVAEAASAKVRNLGKHLLSFVICRKLF